MKTEHRLSNVPAVVELISEEISQSPYNLKQIAQRAHMSPQTVSRLFYKETRFPRAQTVMSLLNLFGYDLFARKSNLVHLKQSA